MFDFSVLLLIIFLYVNTYRRGSSLSLAEISISAI